MNPLQGTVEVLRKIHTGVNQEITLEMSLDNQNDIIFHISWKAKGREYVQTKIITNKELMCSYLSWEFLIDHYIQTINAYIKESYKYEPKRIETGPDFSEG